MNPLSLDPHGSSWSKLPSDLLHSIFERLGFADFQRAKCACSPWESASRQLAPNNQIPWLIQFPEEGKDYCLLLNSEEKNKMYKIRDLGVNFASSHCLATYGSWLFMRDSRYNLYIFNIFTRERIHLPSVDSQFGVLKIERTIDDMFFVKLSDDADDDNVWRRNYIKIVNPLLWMNEKTKDYVVMWKIECQGVVLFHCTKGDNFWRQTRLSCGVDIVYKDHKLYLFNSYRDVKILDFSGDSPREIFNRQVKRKPFKMPMRVYPELGETWNIKKDHLVVTMTGEILRVKSIVRNDSDVWSFRIYKMDSSKSEWEKLTSLGDEAIILDLGITVLANNIEGVNRNSIYFSGDHGLRFCEFDRVWSENDIFIFDLDTHLVERPHRSICSSIQSSNGRWFVPNSKRK